MLAHSKRYTLSHREFDDALNAIAGENRTTKLKLIDQYDEIRKSKNGGGSAAAVQWLLYEAAQHTSLLHQVLAVAQDDAARRCIEAAIKSGDLKKQARMEARLSHQMLKDAAQYSWITEDDIKERTNIPLERRRLRCKVKDSISAINRAVGATGGPDGYPVCTPYELAMRKKQKANQTDWASEKYIYCEEIHKFVSLLDIMKAAGKKRVAEILTLAKGLQDYGEKHNLVPMFYTLTAPGPMHSNPVKGRNRHNGMSPRQTQLWIHIKHRAAFQILRDEGIIPAGIRTVEGHDDETPHWHCIAWIKPEDAARFEAVFRAVAPSWKSTVGCDMKNMLDEPEEGKSKAKAISYLFKYILKSIGGLGENDKIDCELADAIERQDCWRAKHRIRGFQFFGLPALVLWKGFRAAPDAIGDLLLDKARGAAKSGLGCDFIEAAGGLNLKRKERPISARIVKDEEAGKKSVIFENRLSGFTSEQSLKVWKIINEEQRQEIIHNAPSAEEKDTPLVEGKDTSLTVIENHPREPNPTPFSDLEAEQNEVLFGGLPAKTKRKKPKVEEDWSAGSTQLCQWPNKKQLTPQNLTAMRLLTAHDARELSMVLH